MSVVKHLLTKTGFSKKETPLKLHTVRNLHFLSKKSTLISREKLSIFWGRKTREIAAVLDILAVDNFDFTRKMVKKIWVKNS